MESQIWAVNHERVIPINMTGVLIRNFQKWSCGHSSVYFSPK